jgi:mono/diheme cytochrome c family protein
MSTTRQTFAGAPRARSTSAAKGPLAGALRFALAPRFALAALACSILLGSTAVSADPASSAQTAWSPLPARAGAALKDPREQRGRDVFQQRCAACHGAIPKDTIGPPSLPPMAGTQALEARYKGAKPAQLEQRTDLTPEFVKAIVRGGLNSMPFFRPTELSDDDLAALGAYLARPRR